MKLNTLGAMLAAALVAGCAFPGGLPMGTSIEQARSGLIRPNAEYQRENGVTRLEFAQGQFGKQTYMLDFDASGKLIQSQQVLTEYNLGTVRPGDTEASVHLRFGRPVSVDPIGWQKLHVLDYRFAGADCVWYRISISNETGLVTESSLGSDPVCDGGGHARF